MVIRFEVLEAVIHHSNLKLKVDDKSQKELHNIKDGERLLVDTENVAFIYLIECNNEFIHISIGVSVWKKLKEAIDRQLVVTLCIGNEEVVLKQLINELTLLVENIKGNSNYGEETVQLVEEIF